MFAEYSDGNSRFQIHTGVSFRHERVMRFLESIGEYKPRQPSENGEPESDRDTALLTLSVAGFSILEGCILEAEFSDDHPSLAYYWSQRVPLTLPERFELFELTVTQLDVIILIEARNEMFNRGLEIPIPDDEKKSASSNTSSPSKNKAASGKATKKETVN